MDKIKISKGEADMLSRLSVMLLSKYWPKVIDVSANPVEIDASQNDKMAYYNVGYAQAIFDILYDVEAGCNGYLPDNKTITKWANELDKEVITKSGFNWKTYKYNGENKKV